MKVSAHRTPPTHTPRPSHPCLLPHCHAAQATTGKSLVPLAFRTCLNKYVHGCSYLSTKICLLMGSYNIWYSVFFFPVFYFLSASAAYGSCLARD